MANLASIRLYFTTPPALDSLISIGVTGTAHAAFTISETAKTSRTTSGTYKREDVHFTAINIGRAITNDYPFSSYPIGAAGSSDFVTGTVLIQATVYGVTFTVNSLPAGVTYEITPEVLSNLEIVSTEVGIADSDKNNKCKVYITLNPAKVGTAPYLITYYGGSKTAANTGDLFINVSRGLGFDYSTLTITDASGTKDTDQFGGLQYWITPNKVLATFVQTTAEYGTITIKTKLQACTKAVDKEVILETRLVDSTNTPLTGGLGDWVTVSNTRTSSEQTYVIENVPLQEVKIDVRDNFGGYKNAHIVLANPEMPTESIAVIMKANSLNFIDESLFSEPQTFDNRLYFDIQLKNLFRHPYLQKFKQTSNLWVQIQTNYSTVKAYLIGASTVEITSYISLLYTNEGVDWYVLKPSLSALDGQYKIRIEITDSVRGTKYFTSEYFEVKDAFVNTSTVKWYNEDEFGYDSGIFWDEPQEMIVDGQITTPVSGGEKTIATDSDNEIKNISSFPAIFDTFKIYKIPYYMNEKLALALNHSYFEVNGIKYQSDEQAKLTIMEGSLMFKGELILRRVTYEKY